MEWGGIKMKIVVLYTLFFILSTLLIVLALTEYVKGSLFYENSQELRVQKSQKHYVKRREAFIPIRTLTFAQKKIETFLDAQDDIFEDNSIELAKDVSSRRGSNSIKKRLNDLVKVLNHLEEEAILTISTYSEQNGSKAYNLELSQQRADVLKKYFIEKTSLPLIVAIGYGGAVPLKDKDRTKHKQVEINLKRIK